MTDHTCSTDCKCKKKFIFDNLDKSISPQIEQMTVVVDDSLNISVHICAIFIALLLSIQRKELNTSLFIFILFFPYAYFSYIIVGWLID
jgi:hypothetical protein